LVTRKIRTGVVFSLVLAFIVIVAIALYADVPRLLQVLTRFHWAYLPLILGFVLSNYLGRFIKWHYYLNRLQIKLSLWTSLLIFLSGLSMAITPGKVGEMLKSYQLKQTTGAAISKTLPVIVAERLTDGIAMVILATTGLVMYRFGWQPLLVLLAAILIGILIVQNRPLSLRLLSFGERLPVVSRVAHLLRAFYESAYILLQWRPLLLAIGIGVLSWLGECTGLFFVYRGLGIAGSFDLFTKATFILAMASLVGSATGLPGGLGSVDGSMLGLSLLLVSSSKALGAAATLLVRLCTLWFAVFIGIVALLLFRATHRASLSASYSIASSEHDHTIENDHTINNHLPVTERIEDRASAPAPANTGEKIG
jgi:uncharacterized protein (TIRG00374 family)